MMFESMDPGLLAAPLAAGLLVLATHVPLGIEVLRRGIIFIDLAIAQVAALGVIAASLLGFDEQAGGLATQIAAGTAAIAGAVLLTWTERRWPEIQEALIGLLFVFAAAASILLLAQDPHGGEHLRDLLAGQILWVGWARLMPVALLYAGVLVLLWRIPLRSGALHGRRFGFYAVFAMVVMAAVQLVGVLLVFASLIAPAVATRALTGRRRLIWAYGLGVSGYVLGLLASLWFDLPAGAAVVCVLVGLAISGLLGLVTTTMIVSKLSP
jgi:zinc/manganese transport system permease protein